MFPNSRRTKLRRVLRELLAYLDMELYIVYLALLKRLPYELKGRKARTRPYNSMTHWTEACAL